MKILYISDRRQGGIVSHVKCLTSCLPPEVERYVIGVEGDEEFAGTSGHSIREWFQIRRVIKTFKPDVIHFHTIPLFMALYVKGARFQRFMVSKLKGWVRRLLGKSSEYKNQAPSVFCSIHTPSNPHPQFSRRVVNWAVRPCYWLPVSDANWRGFKSCYPDAKGEVFYNPVRIEESGRDVSGSDLERKSLTRHAIREIQNRDVPHGRRVPRRAAQSGSESPCVRMEEAGREERVGGMSGSEWEGNFIIGMVGRNADQKDWPSFHKVEAIVREREEKRGGGGQRRIQFLNAGEKEACNGREAIAKMDLFVMTSKHEELPTTVLECFALGTPICGFLPEGGTSDILQYSRGPVREVFIKERSCEKLADIVMDLMAHPEKRQALVEDGRQILEGHFDAEKNVRGRLMELYRGECGRCEWE